MASDDTVKRYDCTDGGSKFCQGCYTMTECEYGDYVAWEDFDAMRQRGEKAEQALHEIRHANMNGPVSENNAGCIKRIEQIAERALAGVKEGTA